MGGGEKEEEKRKGKERGRRARVDKHGFQGVALLPFPFPFILPLPSRLFIDQERDLEQVQDHGKLHVLSFEQFD